ncbi:hypothetical protein TWF281_002396 [Arthrobotrys megalospora]
MPALQALQTGLSTIVSPSLIPRFFGPKFNFGPFLDQNPMNEFYPLVPNWRWEDLTYLTTTQQTEKKALENDQDGTVKFAGPYCELGLWEHGDTLGSSWIGWPLGRPDKQNANMYWDNLRDNRNGFTNQCANLKDLNNLAKKLSSYKVSGYCECEFFAEEDCIQESTRFSAYNRYDAGIMIHGKDNNDAIQSIRCRYSEGWGGIPGFTVLMIDRKTPKPDGSPLRSWSEGPYRSSEIKKCIKVGHPDAEAGNFLVTDVTVGHATCYFYLDPDCGERMGIDIDPHPLRPLFTLASVGKVDWADSDTGDNWGKRIRSFKCYAGYNIGWHESSADLLDYIWRRVSQ